MSKQYMLTHRGYEIYFDNISYTCPRLNLFGFASDNALMRVINRKLTQRRRSA